MQVTLHCACKYTNCQNANPSSLDIKFTNLILKHMITEVFKAQNTSDNSPLHHLSFNSKNLYLICIGSCDWQQEMLLRADWLSSEEGMESLQLRKAINRAREHTKHRCSCNSLPFDKSTRSETATIKRSRSPRSSQEAAGKSRL